MEHALLGESGGGGLPAAGCSPDNRVLESYRPTRLAVGPKPRRLRASPRWVSRLGWRADIYKLTYLGMYLAPVDRKTPQHVDSALGT